MADYFYLLLEKYPSEEFLRIWKLVLLNQFHDILPGSCIKQVKLKCCFVLFSGHVVVFNFRRSQLSDACLFSGARALVYINPRKNDTK